MSKENRPFGKKAHDRPFGKKAHDRQNTLFDVGRSMFDVHFLVNPSYETPAEHPKPSVSDNMLSDKDN